MYHTSTHHHCPAMSVRTVLLILALTAVTSTVLAQEGPSIRDRLAVSALLKLDKIELDEKQKTAVLRVIKFKEGTDEYVEMAEKFVIPELVPELLKLAAANADSTLGTNAARVALKLKNEDAWKVFLATDDAPAIKLVTALALLGDAHANHIVQPLLDHPERSLQIRTAAVATLGKNKPGATALVKMVEAGKLPADLQFAAANALLSHPDDDIRTAAAKHLKLPATADAKPLPPLTELVKRSGDTEKGKAIFAGVGTCLKCHKVKGEGKEVGPDLSEIGTKLSKEAIYVSILDPSAGISHNYETHVVALDDGTVISGIIVSDTAAELQLKTSEAIIRKFPKEEIVKLKKQNISLMPADLQKALTADSLVDLVEYLTTLKKVGG